MEAKPCKTESFLSVSRMWKQKKPGKQKEKQSLEFLRECIIALFANYEFRITFCGCSFNLKIHIARQKSNRQIILSLYIIGCHHQKPWCGLNLLFNFRKLKDKVLHAFHECAINCLFLEKCHPISQTSQ